VSKSVRRGYSPDDEHDFKGPALEKLKRAAEDLNFLLSRGYPVKAASTFVGNHFLLTERQRIALTRVAAAEEDITIRRAKQKNPETMVGETVNIDGFNVIIPLEVAQSGSPVFLCMDGTYRDLAGLRGTYGLIDKTDAAIRMILNELQKLSVRRGVFWLDAPVSNSGRLKTRLAEIAEEMEADVGIEVVGNVDRVLYELPNVISSDSIILDCCSAWFNLNARIIPGIPGTWIIDIMKQQEDQ
jgi:hypothetical protein